MIKILKEADEPKKSIRQSYKYVEELLDDISYDGEYAWTTLDDIDLKLRDEGLKPIPRQRLKDFIANEETGLGYEIYDFVNKDPKITISVVCCDSRGLDEEFVAEELEFENYDVIFYRY